MGNSCHLVFEPAILHLVPACSPSRKNSYSNTSTSPRVFASLASNHKHRILNTAIVSRLFQTWESLSLLSTLTIATMATPNSTTSQDGGDKKFEQITFRFCSECSNMLYPKEDVETRKLQYTCRTCQYTEEAQSSCVFRNVLNNAAGETAGVTQDVGSDPTVSILNAAACFMCGCPLYGGESSQVAPTDEGYESILSDRLEDILMLGDVEAGEEDGWEKDGEGVKLQDETSS